MNELFAENINGIKICYEIFGDGYPVFLLHGFGAKKEYWIAQVSELSKKFKVITLDLRGNGKSDRPNVPYTMDLFVIDLKEFMNFLQIERAHLIGHSLGGAVVQNFALNYNEKVNKIILICSFPDLPMDLNGLEAYKKSQMTALEARLSDPIKGFYIKMKIRFSRDFFKLMKEEPKKKFHGLFSTEDLMKSENTNPITPQDINNLANAIITHKVLNRLQEVKNETLIIAGDKDRIVSRVASDQIHEKIPNSILEVLSGGHFINLEKAPEVNQIILDFLKK